MLGLFLLVYKHHSSQWRHTVHAHMYIVTTLLCLEEKSQLNETFKSKRHQKILRRVRKEVLFHWCADPWAFVLWDVSLFASAAEEKIVKTHLEWVLLTVSTLCHVHIHIICCNSCRRILLFFPSASTARYILLRKASTMSFRREDGDLLLC